LERRLAEADLQGKVRDFHLKFNFTANPVNEKPTLIPIGLAMKRLKFLQKEIDELEEAEQLGDLVKIADALGDILYFVYGNAVAYGIPIIPIFNEIHRSNMTKNPCLDKDGKAIKGLDYSPPDIEKALRGESEEK
jgi:predicted HAD superfamily Cof-like phosphohydrolase